MTERRTVLQWLGLCLLSAVVGVVGALSTVLPRPHMMVCEVLSPAGTSYHAVEDNGHTHCHKLEVRGL